MKPPREAAEDILFKTLVRGAPVAESIPWPHVTVLGEALTAAIEARDAEHAAEVDAALATLDAREERCTMLERLLTAAGIDYMAATPAVVPAETPGSCSMPHPFADYDEDDLCGRCRGTAGDPIHAPAPAVTPVPEVHAAKPKSWHLIRCRFWSDETTRPDGQT